MADPFPHVDLSCLTPRQREVVEMHYASGLTFRAIGRLLRIDESTVRGHHWAAVERLRSLMAGDTPALHTRG